MQSCTKTQLNAFPSLLLKSDNVLSTSQDKTPRNLQHIDPKTKDPVLQLERICNSLDNKNQGSSERNVCSCRGSDFFKQEQHKKSIVRLTKHGNLGSILPTIDLMGLEKSPLHKLGISQSPAFTKRTDQNAKELSPNLYNTVRGEL